MKITNKHNMPEVLARAVKAQQYNGQNYSASMLNKPVQMVWLQRRHWDKLEEDVTDRLWALFGSGVHAALAAAENSLALMEEYMKFEILPGVFVSGMMDLYEDATIWDFKVTSVWSYIYKEDKMEEFETQLNSYAWLMRKQGFEVNKLQILMLLRDWQASKAGDGNYPLVPAVHFPIRMWNNEFTEQWILERVQQYEKYKEVPDDQLPDCTLVERWAKPGTYAIMKAGRKTALRVLSTVEEAKEYARGLRDEKGESGIRIEARPGEDYRRCPYCPAKTVCDQYKGYQNRGAAPEADVDFGEEKDPFES